MRYYVKIGRNGFPVDGSLVISKGRINDLGWCEISAPSVVNGVCTAEEKPSWYSCGYRFFYSVNVNTCTPIEKSNFCISACSNIVVENTAYVEYYPTGNVVHPLPAPPPPPPLDYINVKNNGAIGDGVIDDTLAIQSVINDAAAANKKVYIPAGIYLVGDLTIPANSFIYGDGIGSTTLVQKEPATSIFRISNTSPSLPPSSKIGNIILKKMTLDDKVQDRAFDEGKELIYATGVSELTIDNVEFLGFRGDGLYLGGYVFYNNQEPRLERHNINVSVSNCVFNGVNKDNRNGISIIDCDGLVVSGCQFKNITKTTYPYMPGAIDFEPDHDWCIINNSTVQNCTFENIGGQGAIIMLSPNVVSYAPPCSTSSPCTGTYLITPPNNFIIQNNTIQDCTFNFPGNVQGAIIYFTDYPNTPLNVSIKGNIINNVNYPTFIKGANTITLENNQYQNSYYNIDIQGCKNFTFSGNTLDYCGEYGNALTIFDLETTNIYNNIFSNFGSVSVPGNAIFILDNGATTTMVDTKINYNTFFSPKNIGSYVVSVQGGVIFSGYKQFIGNTLNGLPSQYP